MQETDYDIIIMDLFYDESAMNADDIVRLKIKSNGASRLLIAYMSVGEA